MATEEERAWIEEAGTDGGRAHRRGVIQRYGSKAAYDAEMDDAHRRYPRMLASFTQPGRGDPDRWFVWDLYRTTRRIKWGIAFVALWGVLALVDVLGG